MARKKVAPPRDPGEQQIDNWEALRLAGTLQKMQDDGLDEATIAREYPAASTLIINVAARLREEYRANRVRGES